MDQPQHAAGLTFAVGDIHGRDDLLAEALAWIAQRAGTTPALVVFLGDYVDRGPHSSRVVERLMKGSEGALSFICLRGNHEDMLVEAFHQPSSRQHWISNGGGATLASYGERIPEDHLDWMAGLQLSYEDQHRVFVHVGLNPQRPIDQQTEHDMLWIREPFLLAGHDFGKHVVHGHTPNLDGPELLPFRTNLDIGAFRTGRLCIAVFDPERPGGPIEAQIVTA